MKRAQKGYLISALSLISWLILAIIFPNFQRYKDPEFKYWHQIVSFTITGMAFASLIYGLVQIFKGRKEK